jgi:hypothetical protein
LSLQENRSNFPYIFWHYSRNAAFSHISFVTTGKLQQLFRIPFVIIAEMLHFLVYPLSLQENRSNFPYIFWHCSRNAAFSRISFVTTGKLQQLFRIPFVIIAEMLHFLVYPLSLQENRSNFPYTFCHYSRNASFSRISFVTKVELQCLLVFLRHYGKSATSSPTFFMSTVNLQYILLAFEFSVFFPLQFCLKARPFASSSSFLF